MRRTLLFTSAVLLAFLAVTGCGQRSEQAQEISSADSLLATIPTEQTSGDLTPQQFYEQPQEVPHAPATPAATRPPVSSRPKTKPAPQQPAPDPGVEVPAGTALAITMTTPLTSETAQVGTAITDESGRYRIQYPKKNWDPDPFNQGLWRPDIFVTVDLRTGTKWPTRQPHPVVGRPQ